MKKLDLRLFRMIKNTKGQYIAVLTIIITGIFIFTAVSNSAMNLRDTLDDYYSTTKFADIFVTAAAIPERLERELEKAENIRQADVRLSIETRLITDNDEDRVNVRAVSVDRKENKINELFIKKGRRNLSEREIIVIDQFALARGIDIGDEINLSINGRKYKFIVTAIAASPEYVYLMENEQVLLPDYENFGVVYIEEDYLRKISDKGSFNEVVIRVNFQDNIDKTKDYLEDELKKYGVMRVIDREEQLSNSMMNEEISGLETVSKSMPIVFLLFAGIMLAVMLSRIVKKDRTSIGVLKAVGFTDNEIISHYLKYAASVGVIGGLAGAIIGTLASGAMTNMYLEFFNIPMLTVKVYYYRIFASVVLSLVFCVVSGFWGIRNIIKINPAESMMPEPPKQGKRILLENFRMFWSRLSFSWRMVYRNIFREKKKFLFIAAAVCITCSLMIMTMWMNEIMDIMFVSHYSEFAKMEYNIGFRGFHDERVLKEVKENISYNHMEGRIELPFEIKNGRLSKIVNVIGLEENTEFYDFRDLNGNKLTIPKDGILISSNLSKSLNAHKGDRILLESFIPDSDGEYVTVKGIIEQSLGINGYMNISYVNRKFLDKGIINGVYINSDDDVNVKLDDIINIMLIQSQEQMQGVFEEFTALIAVFMGVMVIFSGMLGFVILYSMTLMSINERTLEFSSLRVMGFTKIEIFKMLVKENMVMSVLGIIAGIPLGKWLVDSIGNTFNTDIYTLQGVVTTKEIIIAISLTIIFIISAQLMTYVKIKKLDFMLALKSRIS
ncbi:MAG: FtsX-like permease family protein [Tissierellia bacterium]|nr:FtsX-like permease family protein [Tissierellia bacterium]